MGQPVAVVEKSSSIPGMVRFEANRTFSGMGHERFTSAELPVATTPSAVLARRLFDTGKVDAVHVYANIVTVDLRKGFTADGLKGVVEDLYTYYRPGFVPPAIEMPAAEPAAAAAAGDSTAPAAGVDSRVPAHLLERSRAARAKWASKAAG
jgi:hypothetical protein